MQSTAPADFASYGQAKGPPQWWRGPGEEVFTDPVTVPFPLYILLP